MSSSQRLQLCVKLCTGTGITKKLLLSWLFSLNLDVAEHCCCVRPGLCTTFLVITSPERTKNSLEEIPTSTGTSSAYTVLVWDPFQTCGGLLPEGLSIQSWLCLQSQLYAVLDESV